MRSYYLTGFVISGYYFSNKYIDCLSFVINNYVKVLYVLGLLRKLSGYGEV